MLRKKRALTTLVALACTAGLLFPVAAQAADGVCVGRKVTRAGGDSPDPLTGSAATDVLAGLDGADVVSGGGGDDRLCGGNGDDLLSGDAGSDLLRGNAGNDVLIGGDGADRLNGGPGNDICDLGPGDRSSGGCEATMEEDSDRDGLLNAVEVALRTNAFAGDSDGDGESDLDETTGGEAVEIDQADLDDDGDAVRNGADNCPAVPNTGQENTDAGSGDTEGDACDTDDDADEVLDEADNCDLIENADQADLDKDAVGDACDDDLDGDQIANVEDLCPTRMHGDRNYGGCPPLVPGDTDNDGILDGTDNCLLVPNPGQEDFNRNRIGNACEGDVDQDGVNDDVDNCQGLANPLQTDTNGDGIGDACGVPTFEEFAQELFASGFGIVCIVVGLEICEWVARSIYFVLYGGPPPGPPPGCPAFVCGGIGIGIGGIGIGVI